MSILHSIYSGFIRLVNNTNDYDYFSTAAEISDFQVLTCWNKNALMIFKRVRDSSPTKTLKLCECSLLHLFTLIVNGYCV